MTLKFTLFIVLFSLLLPLNKMMAQTNSLNLDSITNKEISIYDYSPHKVIVPISCVAFGALTHTVPLFTKLNLSTRNSVENDFKGKIKYDDFIQYLPAAAVYGFNLFGVSGENNLGDRTCIYASTTIISGITVTALKYALQRTRPDGSNHHSFPSGHTATAFAGAHFMYREFQDKNKLLALSGYPIAALTGVCRVLNNKHWVGDVVAGAGIGVLSTEASYWLAPQLKKILKKKTFRNTAIVPSYHYGELGWSVVKKL